MAAGHRVDAEPVQSEIDAQYRALIALRTVTADEYRDLGRSCVDNDAWRAASCVDGVAAVSRSGPSKSSDQASLSTTPAVCLSTPRCSRGYWPRAVARCLPSRTPG